MMETLAPDYPSSLDGTGDLGLQDSHVTPPGTQRFRRQGATVSQYALPMQLLCETRRSISRPRRRLVALAWVIGGLCGGSDILADPIDVRVRPLDELLQVPVYSAPAAVVARNAPRLAAEIDARLLDLPVAIGERVSPGQALARLDCRRPQSALASAQATHDRAQAQRRFAEQQLRRARNLEKNKSISEELLDQRRMDLAIAEADLQAGGEAVRQAQIDVGHCTIRAPFDAVVTERAASTGDYVTRGRVIVGLLETAAQEVSVALRHDQVASFQEARSLSFESNGRVFAVRSRAVLPLADPVARSQEARLQFIAETAIVGSPGRIVWRGPRSLIPADYLVRRDGGLGVFVLQTDRARFVAIPDAEEGRPASVALPPDSLLITDGRQRLVDGDEVLATAGGTASR
jgi:RND family efflux transporter MFP subunit